MMTLSELFAHDCLSDQEKTFDLVSPISSAKYGRLLLASTEEYSYKNGCQYCSLHYPILYSVFRISSFVVKELKE